MTYGLHPGARRDLREAAAFYRDQSGPALARLFLAEFERAVALLVEYPSLGQTWRYGKRRLLMRRFPYAIIYTVNDVQIRILAVAHSSRRPEYWRERE